MPVLYVALGRRLGYPVFSWPPRAISLSAGKAARAPEPEATGRGMNHYDDQHYREWPFPVSDQEIAENGYLKSMTPAEELAAFLSIRGACLRANGRHQEAMEAFMQASRLAPQCLLYRRLAAGDVRRMTLRSPIVKERRRSPEAQKPRRSVGLKSPPLRSIPTRCTTSTNRTIERTDS